MAEMGDVDGSMELARRATELKGTSAIVWQQRGVLAARHGKLDEARECFRTATEIEPEW